MRNEHPSFSEHDTTLSLWVEDPKDPVIRATRDKLVRFLRDAGWKMTLDPQTKRHYPAIARDHHYGRRGDLEVGVRASGRNLEVEFFQNAVVENRNGGRYDFDKRKKMPYLIGLQYEATVRRIAALFAQLGLPELRRDVQLTGQAFIDNQRAELLAFHGPRFYDPDQWPAYNCTSADKHRLRDGQRVWFIAEWRPVGRWQTGIAFRNINNMWWVLLPCGTVRNEADFRLYTAAPASCRGRRFTPAERMGRLQAAKKKAIAAERFERAAAMRDAISAINAAASAAKETAHA